MKSTGIVRKVDELGRVVIPKELRRVLDINEKDPMEIYVEDDKIILKKYKPNMACFVTGEVSENNLVLLDGRLVLSPDSARYLLEQLKKSVKKIKSPLSVAADKRLNKNKHQIQYSTKRWGNNR